MENRILILATFVRGLQDRSGDGGTAAEAAILLVPVSLRLNPRVRDILTNLMEAERHA